MKHKTGSIRFAGILFILATIGSIAGGLMIGAAVPEAASSVLTAQNRTPLMIGVLLELVNVLCVLGIGSLLASAIRPGSDRAATGYSALRTVEAVFCAAALLAPLALVFSAGEPAGFTAAIFAARTGIVAFLIPVFFCLGALVLYGAMFRLCFVPRFLSIWGFIASLLVLLSSVAGFILPNGIDESLQLMLGLPIILNELILGVWLMIHGFRELEAKPQPGSFPIAVPVHN